MFPGVTGILFRYNLFYLFVRQTVLHTRNVLVTAKEHAGRCEARQMLE